MKHFQKPMAIVMAFLMLAVTLGCSSSTMIHSVPQGAKIYLDDELVGTTPHKITDTKVSGAVSKLVLKRFEYEDFTNTLSKNEQVNVGAVIGGLFFLFPFIWTMGYNPSHTYELIPIQPPLLP